MLVTVSMIVDQRCTVLSESGLESTGSAVPLSESTVGT